MKGWWEKMRLCERMGFCRNDSSLERHPAITLLTEASHKLDSALEILGSDNWEASSGAWTRDMLAGQREEKRLREESKNG